MPEVRPHDNPANVPYIVYESAMARSERHTRRLIVALVIAIVLIAASNMVWLWAWMQYDYTSDMSTTTTTTVDLDSAGGGNANYIGESGDIINGESPSSEENSYYANEDAQKEEWQFEGNT